MRIDSRILLLCCTGLASACSIVSTSCNFLDDKSPVVFVGTVVAPEDPEAQVMLHGSPIVFNVTERLRGNVAEQVSIYEPRTSCDFPFTKGKSFLVFAYLEKGRLTTSELTYTQPTSAAGALLRQLRAANRGQHPVSLFGYLGEEGPSSEQPMTGITILARSKHQTFAAKSEADGSFEFNYLPPGLYSIKAELPKGYLPARTKVQVKPGESCDLEYLWAVHDEEPH